MASKTIYENCSICGNKSGYDKKSLKASQWTPNGQLITLCCPCEDDLFLELLNARISKKKMEELIHPLMMDEQEDIMALYYDHNSGDD